MNNTINIWFRGEQEGTVSSPENPGGQANIESPHKNNAGDKTKGAMSFGKAVGMYVVKQSVSNALSRVGTWTRDKSVDNNISTMTKIAGMGIAFFTNPYLAAAATLVNVVTNVVDYNNNVSQERNRIGMINKRAGSEYNRSRE